MTVSIPLIEHEEMLAASVANITVTSSKAAFSLNLIVSTTTGTFFLAVQHKTFY